MVPLQALVIDPEDGFLLPLTTCCPAVDEISLATNYCWRPLYKAKRGCESSSLGPDSKSMDRLSVSKHEMQRDPGAGSTFRQPSLHTPKVDS